MEVKDQEAYGKKTSPGEEKAVEYLGYSYVRNRHHIAIYCLSTLIRLASSARERDLARSHGGVGR
eukprot:3242471-Pleurochrysis_carterae.AAC.1